MTGCSPGLVFNNSNSMTPDQILDRASHIFIGVIEKQEFENWLFLDVPGAKRGDWAILKRYVRVETVIRGSESRQSIVIYEYFPTGAAIGNSNITRIGERDLFLVRVENGRYHLVWISGETFIRYIPASTTGCLWTIPIRSGSVSASFAGGLVKDTALWGIPSITATRGERWAYGAWRKSLAGW
jgi:hypothetical protein